MGGGIEGGDEFEVGEFGEVGEGFGGVVFGSDADDVALVGSFPSEGGGPFPGGLVDGGHAIDIGVGGAGHFDEAFGGGGFLEGCAVGFDLVVVGAGFAPVDGVGGFVPLGGEAGFVDVDAAAAGAAAVVGEGGDDFFFEVFVEAGVAVVGEGGEVVEADVPAAAVVGVVAGEHVEGG